MTFDYYSIIEKPEENLLIIKLPQTKNTITDTFTPIVERKEKLSIVEQTLIVEVVKQIKWEDYNAK